MLKHVTCCTFQLPDLLSPSGLRGKVKKHNGKKIKRIYAHNWKTEAAQYNGRHFKGVESKCPDPAANNKTKKHVLPFEMGAIVLNMLCVVLSSPHFKHFEHCALCFSFKQ